MAISTPTRAVLKYALVGTPIAVLVFLFAAQFFTAWDGHAVSVFPPGSDGEPAVYRVLVVEDDGSERTMSWPAPLVRRLKLPFDAVGIPPTTLPEGLPHTVKSRYTLHFLVQAVDGSHQAYPTTSPRAVTLALIAWVGGLLARNMIASGSPLQFEKRPTRLPAPQAPAGQVAPRKSRPKKGPPPPRGKRRRR